jgi:O-antigen/teichoic acid export membrane protein
MSVSILSILLSLGMHQLVGVYYFRYEPLHRKQVVVDIVAIYLVLATPLILLSMVMPDVINEYIYFGELNNLIIVIALLTSYLSFFDALLFSLLQMERKVVGYTILSSCKSFIVLSLNVWLVVYLRVGILGIVSATLIGHIISFLVGIYLWRLFYVGIKPRRQPSLVKDYLQTGLPLMPTGLFAWMLLAADRFVLGYFHGPDAVGIYSLAYKFPMIFDLFFVTTVARVYSPRILNMYRVKGYVEADKQNGHYLIIYLVLAGLAAVFTVAVLYFLYPFLVGVEFLESFQYIPFLLGAELFLGARNFSTYLLLYEGRTKGILVTYMVAAIVNILLNIGLIPSLAVMGAVISTVSSYALLFILNFIYKRQVLHQLARDSSEVI